MVLTVRQKWVMRRRILLCCVPPVVSLSVYLYCRRMSRKSIRHSKQMTVDVKAPPEAVFNFITDIARRPQWQSHLKSTEKLTGGPLDVSSRFRDHSNGYGRIDLEVVEFDVPIRFACKSAGGVFAIAQEWKVTPCGIGSRVHHELSLEPRGYMKLLWPITRRAILPMVDKDFDEFARLAKEL